LPPDCAGIKVAAERSHQGAEVERARGRGGEATNIRGRWLQRSIACTISLCR
jgi:hypothetical protein